MSDIKTRNYVNKPLDEMTAEELRHGALKWMTNEGEGLGDARASLGGERSAARSEPKVSRKELKAKIAALEAQIRGAN
jgi:hypothetical protein